MMALVYNTIVFKNKQNYYGNSVDGYDHKTIIFNNVHDYIGNTKDNENAWFAGGGKYCVNTIQLFWKIQKR